MRPSWLLAFPPLITSSWGNCYPSLAILAAVLQEAGASVSQIDLNEEFLDYLTSDSRLNDLRCAFDESHKTASDVVPQRAAVQLLLQNPNEIRSANGSHLSQQSGVGMDLAIELARPFHVDLPVEDVCSDAFLEGNVASLLIKFYSASGLDAALECDLSAVGVSIPMGPQIAPAVLLARYIKSRRPDVRIVFGGPAMTLMARPILQRLLSATPEVDCVVRHEGEIPLLQLSLQIAEGQWNPATIPGTLSRDGVGERARSVRSPKSLPFALYDDRLLARLDEPRLGVLQARGCYWGKCAYCDFIELYSSDRRYNGRTPVQVAEEIQFLSSRHGINRFDLITEALPPMQGQLFAEALLERKLNVQWHSFAMVDPLFTTETFRALADSGCSSLTIGLETMDTRVLKLVRKRATEQENVRFLNAALEAGIKLDINLIPNLPSTTWKEAMSALDALRPFSSVIRKAAVFPFEATASSAIGRSPSDFALKVIGNGVEEGALYPNGQSQFASNRLIYKDEAMTSAELKDVIASYNAFAAQIARSGDVRWPASGHGFRRRSRRVAVMRDADATVVYDWEVDRIFHFSSAAFEIIEWIATREVPFTRGQLATWLVRERRVDKPHKLCQQLLSSCTGCGFLEYIN